MVPASILELLSGEQQGARLDRRAVGHAELEHGVQVEGVAGGSVAMNAERADDNALLRRKLFPQLRLAAKSTSSEELRLIVGEHRRGGEAALSSQGRDAGDHQPVMTRTT